MYWMGTCVKGVICVLDGYVCQMSNVCIWWICVSDVYCVFWVGMCIRWIMYVLGGYVYQMDNVRIGWVCVSGG